MTPKAHYISPLDRYEQSLAAMTDAELMAEISVQWHNYATLRNGLDHYRNWLAAYSLMKSRGKEEMARAATDKAAREIRAKDRQREEAIREGGDG